MEPVVTQGIRKIVIPPIGYQRLRVFFRLSKINVEAYWGRSYLDTTQNKIRSREIPMVRLKHSIQISGQCHDQMSRILLLIELKTLFH